MEVWVLFGENQIMRINDRMGQSAERHAATMAEREDKYIFFFADFAAERD